jgi:hypothetical protein
MSQIAIQILDSMAELLDSPEKLCKEAFARDYEGNPIDFDNPNAIQWCMGGALYKYSKQHNLKNSELLKAASFLKEASKSLFGDTRFSVISDSPNSYPKVIQIIEKAKELAKAKSLKYIQIGN